MKLWKFIVDDAGTQRAVYAQTLTVTDAGWLKFWAGKRLVGVVKSNSWLRVYLAAASQEKP